MRRNAETLRPLITHRFPLDRIADAYAAADDKSEDARKAFQFGVWFPPSPHPPEILLSSTET